ncbi:MAG: late competence development ComFB family protein [Hungatella sp.]
MYKNVTEILVEQKLEILWKNEDCCKCRRCHDDVMAYSLNRLPTQYVSTSKGELFNRATALSRQSDIEVISVITRGIELVAQQPRHSIKEKANGYDIFKEQD